MSVFRPAALALALATALSAGAYMPSAVAANAPAVDIPYESFTLPNGLRVVVHTDRKAPIVAVNIWYHVGSKDEPAGRTGFAHLFEHLMFNGSENNPGEFFTPFEQAGTTDQNGTTNSDRTNYFENVPTTALDMALWMESDRMGHLLGAIDQKTLDEQRGVVQNEKRQGENRPYGQLQYIEAATLYPEGHPYHHTVIGSMNDLDAASLDDVKTWFKTWYGPNNAVLVLAGDIDVATAKEKVAKYFGDIPASPTMAQPKVSIPELTADGRTEIEDKVPQVMVDRTWNVAQAGTRDADLLGLFASVLGGSANSRLQKRLVYQEQLVDSISAYYNPGQIVGMFGIEARIKQGVDPAKVEAIADEELRKLLMEGPTAEELARVKTDERAGFVRGIERIGGFGGKADVLASCVIYTGKAGCFRDTEKTIADATPDVVRAAAAKWLDKHSHTFVVKPGERTPLVEAPAVKPAPFVLPEPDGKYKTTASNVDRKAGVPEVKSFPELKLPALQRATLANGSQVVLAERHDIPVVNLTYQFAGGGYASDPAAKPGLASFAAALLSEGAGDLDSLAFKARAEELGARLGAGASLDGASAGVSALKENLEPTLQLFADFLQRPRFDQAAIDRVKAQRIAGIRQIKASPTGLAMRVLPTLLYGEGHPYGAPSGGSGTEASVAALGRADLLAWRDQWLRPQGATLIVVGDTTLDEIVPVLNKQLGAWTGEGTAATPPVIAPVKRPTTPRVFLIDQPASPSAVLAPAEVIPPTSDALSTQFEMSNGVLGGQFSSRLNMNLREDKHWSYGIYSYAADAVGQRVWMAPTQVQIDKTAESVQELVREIGDYASGKRPATQEEVAKVVNNDLRGQPGAYETAAAVASTIAGIVRYHRPDNWVTVRNAEVAQFTPQQAANAAKWLNADALTWVIVGDLSKTEAPIRALNLGEVTVLDADGKPVVKK
ncbi:M16 family metallopeptidase [Thermomonas brevis]